MRRSILGLSLTLLVGAVALTSSAANPKITFNNLGHSGKPDLKALYGITLLPSYARTSVAGYATSWPSATGLPTAQWYTDFATLLGSGPVDKWLIIDHESYAVSTQAERQAASDKFVTIYNGIKAVRPDVKVGFYQYPIIRDFYNAIDDPSSQTYIDWQAKNTDFATMAAVVDGYFPSIYNLNGTDPGVPTGGTNYFHIYALAQINESKRLRTTYGRASQGIYPYVYWRTDVDNEMPSWIYEDATRTAYTAGDGLTLFGGSGHAWSDTTYGGVASWFTNFIAQWPFGDRSLTKPRNAAASQRGARQ